LKFHRHNSSSCQAENPKERRWRWSFLLGSDYAPAENICAAISLVDCGGGSSGIAVTAGDACADAGEHGVGQVDDPGEGERSAERTIEAKEWDLNWWGGIELREVRLFDKKKGAAGGDEEIADGFVGVDVVFGDMYNLGKTKAEGLAVNFKKYNDGTTNFSDLVKKTPGTKTVKEPPPFKMPDLKGEFDIDFRGRWSSRMRRGIGRRFMWIEARRS